MNGGLSMVEMKRKYKKSEYGLIPVDWKEGTFADFLEGFSAGATPYRGITSNFKGKIKWISSGELNYNRINDTIEHISEEAFTKTSLKIHPEGTFLMAITGLEAAGTRGRCAFVGNPAATNQSCMAIYPTDKMINEYLYYFYRKYSEILANKYCQGTKQKSYTSNIVKLLPIVCPPSIKEQASIAAALSDVDSLISALTKKIEKKKAIKQGLMQQLLTGKKRLPGYEKNREPVQTEWGAIPKDWKTLSIGKCCSIKARIGWQGLKKSEYLSSGEYVLVTGTDFLNGRIDWKSCVYVSKKRYEQDANIQIVKHDILITKDGTIGKVAFLDDVPCLGTLNSGIFVVRSHSEELDQCYLSKIFESFIFDAFLESLVAGSTINHLYQKDFVHFNFPVPPTMSEQTAIANILSDCDSEIAALEEKRDKYKEIKQGMMQQLLTGKIRLIK